MNCYIIILCLQEKERKKYLLAEVLSAFDIFGFGLASLASLTGGVAVVAGLVED